MDRGDDEAGASGRSLGSREVCVPSGHEGRAVECRGRHAFGRFALWKTRLPCFCSGRSDISFSRTQYTPNPPEPVLGIIVARHAEGYRVDIGSSQGASLDALAFEGATKRNKPNLKVSRVEWLAVFWAILPRVSSARLLKIDTPPFLQVGTLVYAHLLSTPPFSEPEISCVDPSTQKASGFGELQGGFLIRGVELGRCRACVPSLSTLLLHAVPAGDTG